MRARTAKAGVTTIPESLLQEQVVADETISFVREHTAAAPEVPWFVCASFSRPHFPLTAPKRWIDYYHRQGITEPFVAPGGDAFDHPMSVGMRKGFRVDEISAKEAEEARLAYFACVSYLDEVLGDLFARLAATGDLDNTIIVYTSDHGEMAGEHGVWWKNGWYEACTHVPLLISTPEQRAGEVPASNVETPVALVDIFPTLCGAAKISVPDGLDGRDLSPALNTADPDSVPVRPVVCDALMPRWGEGTEFRMVRSGDFKYVRFRDAAPLMFNLAKDPNEQHNIAELPSAEIGPDAAEARDLLAAFAQTSMDFDRAERDRTERDAPLKDQYPLAVEGDTPNLYHLPDGRIVNAEDTLYEPTVIAEKPEQTFADFPGRQSDR
jgi:choline-sulfatase